jgi:hypothetical protein
MNRYALAVAVLLAALPAVGGKRGTRAKEYSWSNYPASELPAEAEVGPASGGKEFDSLTVSNAAGRERTFTLRAIEEPGVGSRPYAIGGWVRSDGVEGRAYLELLSHFPEGGPHFTRTLAETGELAHLGGTIGWRRFRLPFKPAPGAGPPTKLVVNLVMPGAGTVEISPLSLMIYSKGSDPFASAPGWWTPSQAGLLGGLAGAVIGGLGALIGALGGRGRARGFVMTALAVMPGAGAAVLVAGLVALWVGQPYHVYYGPLLAGGILVVVPLALRPVMRRRYEQDELRKMKSVDAH